MTQNERIVDWLTRHGKVATPTEVRDGLGMSRTAATRNCVSGKLNALSKAGLVRRVVRGGPRTQGLWSAG